MNMKMGRLAAVVVLVVSVTSWAGKATLQEELGAYVLSNGIVEAKINKTSGGLLSLKYNGTETLNIVPNKDNGKWSHDARSDNTKSRITINPASNNGARVEIAVKGLSNGKPMGSGPGGSAIADIEIRYCLEADSSGIYTYSIWTHQKDYPATNIGEARFYVKLDDNIFNWLTIDKNRNREAITAHDWNYGEVLNAKEMRRLTTGKYIGEVEHKYTLSASQFDNLAWGWSSTERKMGIWFINPTIEYLSGGPTKIELSAHRDATFTPDDKNTPAPPCLLNYWRSSHYGGSVLFMDQGEEWTKVIGPFLIYFNQGETPDAMWKDALFQSVKETAAWPKDFVQGVDYPTSKDRAIVSGKIVLNDPGHEMSQLLVGLTAPDYSVPAGKDGAPVLVSWGNDAKHYQHWVRGNNDGSFTLPAVRPGTYTLRAIATGVLGEYSSEATLTITPGQRLDLGTISWTPVRLGKQLWDIGIPNRNASEFRHGDDYFKWGHYLEYSKDFPNNVNYTIGVSDFRKDWNYAHVPTANPADTKATMDGTATPWTIHFKMDQLPPAAAKCVLRLAICGAGGCAVDIQVNDHEAGTTGKIPYNSTIVRDAVQGSWQERRVEFPASLLKKGDNTLVMTVPAGNVTNGVEYDYLRLELVEEK